MVLTDFGVPLTHFGSFPIRFGDSFTREPFLNSDAPLKVSIDAWGTAVVPTGAFEVLRVRTSVIYSAFRGSAAFGSAAAPVIEGAADGGFRVAEDQFDGNVHSFSRLLDYQVKAFVSIVAPQTWEQLKSATPR